MLQCSRGLTAAEILHPGPGACMLTRFNAAAASRPRKSEDVRVSGVANSLASMQPRPHGRGNHEHMADPRSPLLASMQPRPHGRGNGVILVPIRTRHPSRFNAAAASRPRKSSKAAGARRRRLPASMQPRPHGRGNPWWRQREPPPRSCFNAAAASRPRKSKPAHAAGWRRDRFNAAAASRPREYNITAFRETALSASMQPRPHGRGNSTTYRLSAMCIQASMQPRPHGRGNLRLVRLRHATRTTSMQPRPHGRGN